MTDTPTASHNLAVRLTRKTLLRLALFFLLPAVCYVLSGIAISLTGALPVTLRRLAGLTIAALAAFLMLQLYRWMVRFFERRRADEVATEHGLYRTLAGIACALVMFTAFYAIMLIAGLAHWQGWTGNLPVLALAIAILSGVGEELVFRAGIFRVVENGFGTGAALIVSALLFGLLHLANPNATVFSALAIALEAGLLLGLCYTATRNLWLPVGLHAGWNFAEGGIFSAAVSGSRVGKGLIDIPLSGPEIWTGGAFGPEASVVVLLISLLPIGLFLYLTIRRGQWQKRRMRWTLPIPL